MRTEGSGGVGKAAKAMAELSFAKALLALPADAPFAPLADLRAGCGPCRGSSSITAGDDTVAAALAPFDGVGVSLAIFDLSTD